MTDPLVIRPFSANLTDAVVALWRSCDLVVPWNDPYEDIARKRSEHPELFLVGLEEGRPIGTVMAGWDGHRGWLNYVAVARDNRGRGVGRALVRAAEVRLAALGCPKVNLQVRRGSAAAIGFYRALGYEVDDVVSLGRRFP